MIKTAIIGTGLIGGSLGLALRRKTGKRYFVTGIGRNPEKLKAAKKSGAVDAFTTDYGSGVKDADIVVICMPVHLIEPSVRKILPFLKRGAVITDAGSVKGSVIKDINRLQRRLDGKSVFFVGAHPMAGSERSGIKAAKADLYKGAAVVVVKSASSIGGKKALETVKAMWRKTGAVPLEMTAGAHDRAVAVISHLPHVIAFSLSLLADRLGKNEPSLSRLAAGSFRDLTRIAGSNPSDWASICGANSAELSKTLDLFIGELKTAGKMLANRTALGKRFEKARIARQKLLRK